MRKQSFQSRRWSCITYCLQIDVSWHSVTGLTLYIDGELVDEDANPSTNELDFNSTLRFVIGRANTDMRREHFTNGVFDNVEFWETTRSVMKSMGFLGEGQMHIRIHDLYVGHKRRLWGRGGTESSSGVQGQRAATKTKINCTRSQKLNL